MLMAVDRIMFSRPFVAGLEAGYLLEVLRSTVWHGDGGFTARATDWLRTYTGAAEALLTTSCTHALEMAAILLDLGPGDEVVCPSFTFPSTATAIAIRGATPVFVDIRPDTLNIDPVAAEAAITDRTRAIFVVHYGGIAADVAEFQRLCAKHGLALVEDNAHALGASWQGRHLGTFGTFGAQSWHDTKNISCGEGGALLINDASFRARAEAIREKGTDRSRFLRGEIDKYSWVDVGSSYLPSDLLSAILLAQFERFEQIQGLRSAVWQAYDEQLGGWADTLGVTRMSVPDGCIHPAHLYFLIMPTLGDQHGLIEHLRAENIVATFHYQPLDSSPAGLRYGRTPAPCTVTANSSQRVVRLPLHPGMSEADASRVIVAIQSYRSQR
jgi:dTDP-4-amino-4,6-dideoxygalactose transaminase